MSDEKRSSVEEEVHSGLHQAAERLMRAREHSILLIEDTAAHAAIMRRALDSNVWEIEHVTRAAEGLGFFQNDPNRSVILDLSLPDGDGLQCLTRLRALNPTVPVVVVTATDQVSVSVAAMQRGACDYVVKSDPKESGTRIAAAVERAWKSRLRAAEAALVEQSKLVQLVRAERLEAMEQIVKTVCAEVNNPLSGVMALGQLLQRKDNLDSDMQQLADGIVHSASEVAKVVDKLKNLSDDLGEVADENVGFSDDAAAPE